ncbi:hypothetical protein [Fusobacterium ulcerans]|uniref:hypothetical protein n=1 Tax=Fusobacterium ulcerans TaxID=861 RepID=UPI0026F1A974|nr:hypothetical protein [Fusobacterium ulcerans]
MGKNSIWFEAMKSFSLLTQLGIMVVGVFSALFILRRKKKMKKFIFLIMIGMYSLIFTNDKYDILEDRIENTLEYNFKTLNDRKKKLKIKKYDIDISENYVNLKAKINSEVKSFDFDKAFIPVREEIKKK